MLLLSTMSAAATGCWLVADLGDRPVRADAADAIAPVNPVDGGDAGRSRVTGAQVAVGRAHACALDVYGDVYCWGNGVYGQLGIPPESLEAKCGRCMPKPTRVEGLPPIRRLASGLSTHSCAIDLAGAIWCWGLDDRKQLGHSAVDQPCAREGFPTVPCNHQPIKVEGIPVAIEVAAGANYTCARMQTDELWCWGDNTLGQAGQPASPAIVTPSPVAGLLTRLGAVSLSPSGSSFLSAVLQNGSIRTWGVFFRGSLGRNTTTEASCVDAVPCQHVSGRVIEDGTGLELVGTQDVALAGLGGMSLQFDGTVRVWGAGDDGILGDGKGSNDGSHDAPFAKTVAGLPPSIRQITSGPTVRCAVTATDAHCWGRNDLGQTGVGTASSIACDGGALPCVGTPTKAKVPGPVRSVRIGGIFGVALLGDGRIAAWGDNAFGELGHAPGTEGDEPSTAPAGFRNVTPRIVALPSLDP
jgi:alpha-tubulin suppressor-like RCC1 family protein